MLCCLVKGITPDSVLWNLLRDWITVISYNNLVLFSHPYTTHSPHLCAVFITEDKEPPWLLPIYPPTPQKNNNKQLFLSLEDSSYCDTFS